MPIDFFDFNEDEYNTVFEYELDEFGLQVAHDGMENLRVSAPFVLAMLSEIEEITIESTGEKFKYNRNVKCGLENATVSEIILELDGKEQFLAHKRYKSYTRSFMPKLFKIKI